MVNTAGFFLFKIAAFSPHIMSHLKLKLTYFEREKSRDSKSFLREVFRSKSVYYIYHASKKQKANFKSLEDAKRNLAQYSITLNQNGGCQHENSCVPQP